MRLKEYLNKISIFAFVVLTVLYLIIFILNVLLNGFVSEVFNIRIILVILVILVFIYLITSKKEIKS